MKARILLFVLSFILFVSANAQLIRNCGTMENLERLKSLDPALAERMAQVERQTAQWISDNGNEPNRTVVTVPVVFHILYNTSAQNIPDNRILAQLDVLNADFARLNADAVNTPSVFASVGANTNIQFCLAQRDPGGNATTGMVRKSTTTTSFGTNDNAKHNSTGGDDAWPAASYLNIWVCNLGGGLLGYAQFPGGPASTDGVVVLYSSVGGPSAPGTAVPYHLGRTATHEVGHWVNLYHIWGDDGNGCNGSDLVGDTPNQGSENYGCPAFPHISCTNGPNGDMFMNYMDYTDDGCMNIFTLGQSSRMSALFAVGGSRYSILSSLGCVAPTQSACNVPTGQNTTSITTSAATLNWSTVAGAVSYNIQYKQTSSQTWTSTTSTTNSKSISSLTANTNYEWQVQTVCSSTGSAFSASALFTTLSASGCTDVYETNNTSSAARVISVNTDISALIGTSADVDWFKFTTTSPNTKVRITLTNLPADYDVALYRNQSNQVGISQNSGTANETIIYNTNQQHTYYVKVYGFQGAFNAAQCYTLRASVSSSNFRGMDGNDVPVDLIKDEISIYPNPANSELWIESNSISRGNVSVKLIDILGKDVQLNNFAAFDGFNQFKMDISGLTKGVYFIEITNDKTRYVRKLVISR